MYGDSIHPDNVNVLLKPLGHFLLPPISPRPFPPKLCLISTPLAPAALFFQLASWGSHLNCSFLTGVQSRPVSIHYRRLVTACIESWARLSDYDFIVVLIATRLSEWPPSLGDGFAGLVQSSQFRGVHC